MRRIAHAAESGYVSWNNQARSAEKIAMQEEILVLVCSTCGVCDREVMGELVRLEQEGGAPLCTRIEECLDTCESEPSFMVDGASIAPASLEKLRRAVEMARQMRKR